MLRIVVLLQSVAFGRLSSDRLRGDSGQTLPEYALVIVGAAALATLLLTWVSNTDMLGSLLDSVIENVIGRIF
ncbi:MAG: DUF4244 domain-containing protein [Acidimicrobiales bacterium]